MPRLLKICFGDIRKESRDLRELSAAREAGYDIVVLSNVSLSNPDKEKVKSAQGIEAYRVLPTGSGLLPRLIACANAWKRVRASDTLMTLMDVDQQTDSHPLIISTETPRGGRKQSGFLKAVVRKILVTGKAMLSFVLRRLECVILPAIRIRAIQKIPADVISCHDLEALSLGYLSTLFRKKKAKPLLVYDAHEYELGRNTDRGEMKTFFAGRRERYLMKRCAFGIAVNDSIADAMQSVHHLSERPIVARSTPICWDLDTQVIAKRRNELRQMANASSDAFLVMYHGGILRNRGIDLLVEAVAQNSALIGFVMGYVLEEDYFLHLREMIKDRAIENRMFFLPHVPQSQIWEYAGAVDVGFMMIQNTCESYYLCLPNKFFECVQSLTPMVASAFPELKRLIHRYHIGLTCNPENLDEINACIEKMRTDKVFYSQCKESLQRAKRDLCWENEKRKLIDAYAALPVETENTKEGKKP